MPTSDAWNRLVKAQSRQDSDLGLQTAEYDGLGRRIQKVVSNSGGLDGSFTLYYDSGWRMLEVRDGSANVVAQVYGGTQYMDEVVAMRVEDGYMVVNQDANWNVVSATDLAGRVLERTFYTAYGLPTFNSETYFGDYDGDGEVDSTDDGHLGSGQTCWGASPSGTCRVFDFDQDGDLDNDDQTVMTALVALASTNHVRLARVFSVVDNWLTHEGLRYDGAVSVYHTHTGTMHGGAFRYMQRNAVGTFEDVYGGYQYDDQMNLYGPIEFSGDGAIVVGGGDCDYPCPLPHNKCRRGTLCSCTCQGETCCIPLCYKTCQNGYHFKLPIICAEGNCERFCDCPPPQVRYGSSE